jgi:malonyl-CoA decarboxylase
MPAPSSPTRRHARWSTPAFVLEKILRYEAVHQINDWDDLRRRIDPPDRGHSRARW